MHSKKAIYSQKKIAVIACSNGLGHIRRLILILSFLIKNEIKHEIHFFCSEKKLNLIKNWDEASSYYLVNWLKR